MNVGDKSSVYGDGSCEACPGKDESPYSLCKHQTHIEIQLLCNLLYHLCMYLLKFTEVIERTKNAESRNAPS